MNKFEKLILQDIRLLVLQVLNEDADYQHNEHILKSALRALGHNISADKLRTELAWLAEQGLVSTDEVANLLVAKLTRRGRDAAIGAVVLPGVARPVPEL